MPETFTTEDFSGAGEGQAGPATFTPDDFSATPASSDTSDIFRPEDFAPGAKSAVPGSREARRLELKLEMQRVRSEPEAKIVGATPRGVLSSIVEGANKGAGAIVRGLGHLMEIMPPGGPDVVQSMPYAPRGPEDVLGQQYQEKVSDPLKLKEAIERNPLTQAGKSMEETGEAFAPEDFERGSVVNQAISGAAELAPVMNPAAPVVIGLQGLGRDIQNDFEDLKGKGASDQDAAAGAIKRAELAGFSQFAVWTVLPEPLRKFGEKYLIERVGEDGAKRFLAGRVATAGEGAALGATSKAAENVATGQPIGQDVGKSGLSMATLNLGLPRINRAGQDIPDRAEPAAPIEPPPQVPVNRDLAAELQAAMRGNQVRSSDAPSGQNLSSQPATAATSSSTESIKDNLVGDAVRTITGQIPGAKVTIESPKTDFTAEDFSTAPKGENENAIQKPGPEALPVREPSGDREALGAGNTETREPAGESHDEENSNIQQPTSNNKDAAADEERPGEAAPADEGQKAKVSNLSAEDQDALRRELEEELGQEKIQPADSGSDGVNQSVHSEPGEPDTTVEQPPGEVKTPPEPPTPGKRVGRGLRARRIFERETEMNGPDILDWIVDNGGMLSKSAARQKWGAEKFSLNRSLWDDAPTMKRPHHNVIYNPGSPLAPDQVAQAAYNDRVLKAPDVNELWKAIDRATKGRSHAYEQDRRHETILREEIAQNKRWRQMKANGPIRVDAGELEIGDTMDLAGEQLKVTEKDPETGDVTLEDGSKFGTQRLDSGDSIYVEHMGEDLAMRLPDDDKRFPAEQEGSEPSEAEPANAGAEPKPDVVEHWLDEAIRKTDPLAGGQVYEGVSGLPVWLTKSLANGALRVLRIAYRASKDIQASINEAVNWLREQRIKGFDDNQANDWLKGEVEKIRTESGAEPVKAGTTNAEDLDPGQPPKAGQRPVDTIKVERDQADGDLREAIKLKAGERKAEHAQRVAQAAAKFHNLEAELHEHPDYVKELIEKENAGDEGAAKELEQVPDAFKERMRKELEGAGKLPRTKTGPVIGGGRSIDALTDWLKQNDIDSPKRSLRERLNLADKLASRWQGAKDALDRARTSVAASWRTGLEAIKHPPIDTGFRNAFKDWIFYDTWTGAQTKDWRDTIKGKVDSPLRRMAISIWLDAKGDQGLLKYQRDAIPERWKSVWDKALELTPDEQNLARQIKADFEQKLADSKNAGLIEKGRQDYGVPQVWAKAPEPPIEQDSSFATENGPQGSPGNWAAKLDPRDPFFAFQRSHPTYFDGIMAGGVPKSLDVADLVAVYNEAFHKSLGSRAAIWAMKNVAAQDGLPLTKISGSARLSNEQEPGTYFIDSHSRRESDVSADGRPYRPIDHFALRDWKVAHKTADGKLVFVRGDMLVHPDHYDFLKNELMKSPLREGPAGKVLNVIRGGGLYLKASKLALGTFHLATVAEHAVFHWINPFTNGFEIDLRKPDQAGLVKGGTELGLSGSQVQFEEGLASGHGGLFEKIPGLGDVSRKLSDWLFKGYIPALKMKTALDILARNRKRYSGELSDGQIFELTSNQVNAAFGLQNYRLLGRNKILTDLSSMAALAPDFLESRVKVVAQALKPYGAEQRRMLLLQAATMYVGARLLNSWLDDDAHWEPKLAFNVVVKGRAYGLRTIVGDMWHLFTDPKSFAAGRLAPLARIAIETMTQRDLRTGARKEPPFQTEFMPSRVAQNLVVDLAKWLLPIGAEGFLPGAAGREQGPVDTLLSSIGVGSHKYTSATEVSGWARDFNRNGDAHARTFQRQQDAEPHGESTYRKLDALLDAGKLDQAATEYRALLQDGHSDKSIEQRYERSHPFTGNRAREQLFQQSLSDKQKQIYQRALDERKTREAAFKQMMDRARAATN